MDRYGQRVGGVVMTSQPALRWKPHDLSFKQYQLLEMNFSGKTFNRLVREMVRRNRRAAEEAAILRKKADGLKT